LAQALEGVGVVGCWRGEILVIAMAGAMRAAANKAAIDKAAKDDKGGVLAAATKAASAAEKMATNRGKSPAAKLAAAAAAEKAAVGKNAAAKAAAQASTADRDAYKNVADKAAAEKAAAAKAGDDAACAKAAEANAAADKEAAKKAAAEKVAKERATAQKVAEDRAASYKAAFRAKDVETALSARAKWMSLLDGCSIFENDKNRKRDSDSESSSASDAEDKDESRKEKDVAATAAAGHSVDRSALVFKDARTRFASADFESEPPVSHSVSVADFAALQKERVEPPARRLRRLQEEVHTLCSWTEARQANPVHTLREVAVVSEAERLSSDVAEVAGRVRDVVDRVGGLSSEAVSRQMWLPPSASEELQGARSLLELSRVSCGSQDIGVSDSQGSPTGRGGPNYRMDATLSKSSGWLSAANAETLHALEVRVRHMRDIIGQTTLEQTESAGRTRKDQSILGAVASLSKRMEVLEKVNDDAACEQLLSSIQMLSADLDVATAEAKRLSALEAEEKEADEQAGPGIAVAEATPADQIEKLHKDCATAQQVARRIDAVYLRLREQEQLFCSFGRFAHDLAAVEAQTRHAAELLKSATSVAMKMKDSVVSSREQLEKNVASLEAKLRTRQLVAGLPTPPDGPSLEAALSGTVAGD